MTSAQTCPEEDTWIEGKDPLWLPAGHELTGSSPGLGG